MPMDYDDHFQVIQQLTASEELLMEAVLYKESIVRYVEGKSPASDLITAATRFEELLATVPLDAEDLKYEVAAIVQLLDEARSVAAFEALEASWAGSAEAA